MGNFFSDIDREIEIEDSADEIMNSPRFIEYQDKFSKLRLPQDIYIDEDELIIEVVGKTSYSIQQYAYDWLDPEDIERMYKNLERLYRVFSC